MPKPLGRDGRLPCEGRVPDMVSERVYRVLLLAYPKEHRREYGDLMVQLFRDRMRFDGNGFRALIIWVQMISDLVRAAFKEHKKGVDMTKRFWIGAILVVLLVAGGIGMGTLLASSESGPRVAVFWQRADGVDAGQTDGEPRVSVSWQEAEGIAEEEMEGGPGVSVSWQRADGVAARLTDGEPRVSVSWQEAYGVVTE